MGFLYYTYIDKLNILAHMTKQCNKCGQTKSTSDFSKCSSNKDGLQYQCKSCNVKTNHKFRTEINPSHHAEWQRNHFTRLCELVRKYRKADKNSLIYSIRNPEGETYIGMTQMYMQVRKFEHISHYNKAKRGYYKYNLPLLHSSFDKYGVDNHQFEVIADFGEMDREQLRFIETSFIKAFQEIGKSLNINA